MPPAHRGGSKQWLGWARAYPKIFLEKYLIGIFIDKIDKVSILKNKKKIPMTQKRRSPNNIKKKTK